MRKHRVNDFFILFASLFLHLFVHFQLFGFIVIDKFFIVILFLLPLCKIGFLHLFILEEHFFACAKQQKLGGKVWQALSSMLVAKILQLLMPMHNSTPIFYNFIVEQQRSTNTSCTNEQWSVYKAKHQQINTAKKHFNTICRLVWQAKQKQAGPKRCCWQGQQRNTAVYIQQKKLHNNKIYRQQQQQEEEEEHYLPAICKFFSKTGVSLFFNHWIVLFLPLILGKCDKGNTCSFLHDKQQVPECKFFSQGRCNVQSCPFKHVSSSNNNNNNGALPASQSKDKKRARSPEQEEEERQSKKAKPNDDDGMSIVPQFFKSKMEML